MKLVFQLVASACLLGSAQAAEAQLGSRPPQTTPPLDSSQVYVYVAKMPEYPGGRNALLTDLRREFQVAGAAAGCATPPFPVYVRLLVGPSGYVYAARSFNAEATAVRRQSAACEEAIGTAGRHLRRLQPGRQANKPVTVELVVKLLDGNK